MWIFEKSPQRLCNEDNALTFSAVLPSYCHICWVNNQNNAGVKSAWKFPYFMEKLNVNYVEHMVQKVASEKPIERLTHLDVNNRHCIRNLCHMTFAIVDDIFLSVILIMLFECKLKTFEWYSQTVPITGSLHTKVGHWFPFCLSFSLPSCHYDQAKLILHFALVCGMQTFKHEKAVAVWKIVYGQNYYTWKTFAFVKQNQLNSHQCVTLKWRFTSFIVKVLGLRFVCLTFKQVLHNKR